MRTYIIRRVLLLIPTFFLLTLLVFLSVRFLPGDVVDAMMARVAEDQGGSAYFDRERVERMLGLDVPAPVQYVRWLGGIVLRGTLGDSLFGGATVEAKIIGRLAITVELGVLAILIGLVIAVPVGIYSAVRQDTASRLRRPLHRHHRPGHAQLLARHPGADLPRHLVGVGAAVAHGGVCRRSAPQPRPHACIPSLILGTYLSATVMRMTRTMMLEVLRQDFIRTAWAKGLRERLIILRHVIKNALIPVVTLIGLQLPILVGGSVIMENMFALPGLGRLMLEALNVRDYPVVSGINLFFATAVMTINLLIDILYGYLDPRVKYR